MSDRLMKEIEEILRKAETEGGEVEEPRPVRVRRRPAVPRPRLPSVRGPLLTSGRLMVLGVALLIASLVVFTAGGPRSVGVYLIWAGILAFVVAYGLYFARGGGPGERFEKRWRGRPVDDEPPPLRDRFRNIFRRR